MKITYESICQKLGFDPMNDTHKYPSAEDDSVPSRFSVLSLEEHLLLTDYISNAINNSDNGE